MNCFLSRGEPKQTDFCCLETGFTEQCRSRDRANCPHNSASPLQPNYRPKDFMFYNDRPKERIIKMRIQLNRRDWGKDQKHTRSRLFGLEKTRGD